jgi:hypothetical protein
MDDITSKRNMWTQVKMKNCGGFSCIISPLAGNYTRISGDQTDVAYTTG